MLQATLLTGRLMGLRSVSPITMAEVGALRAEMGNVFAQAKGARVIACVDMRRAGVVAQEIADVFAGMLKSDNPMMERSAWLLPSTKAALSLQVERLIAEGGNQNR